jgi:hypothetical protein
LLVVVLEVQLVEMMVLAAVVPEAYLPELSAYPIQFIQ